MENPDAEQDALLDSVELENDQNEKESHTTHEERVELWRELLMETFLRAHVPGYVAGASDEDGCTALMRATGRRHINVALYLIRKGANVTLKDNRGATFANIASAMGLTTIIEVCI